MPTKKSKVVKKKQVVKTIEKKQVVSKQWRSLYVLSGIVVILLAVTLFLLLMTYFSNN